MELRIQYAKTKDVVNIAFTTMGVGPALAHLHADQDVEHVEAVNRGLAKTFGGDNVWDISRECSPSSRARGSSTLSE